AAGPSVPEEAPAPLHEPAPLVKHQEQNTQFPSLEALERELLPLPEEQPTPPENSAQMDEVLAGGGFISEDESQNAGHKV
ncbi:MAG: hypothetical protein RRY29_10065, partial [Desulfovibrionaceae bacterium]